MRHRRWFHAAEDVSCTALVSCLVIPIALGACSSGATSDDGSIEDSSDALHHLRQDAGGVGVADAGGGLDAGSTDSALTSDVGDTGALPPSPPSYFVSQTSGDDNWSGTLDAPNSAGTDGPFKTLGRAQTVARTASAKRIGVEGGTYVLGTGWTFDSSDAGEVWLSYPTQGGAVIDGASAYYVEANGATSLAIDGLTFQHMAPDSSFNADFILRSGSGYSVRWNTFVDCLDQCLVIDGASSTLIDSNTVHGQSPGNVPGDGIGNAFSTIAVQSWTGSSDRVTIGHNLVENTQGGAISVGTGPMDGDITNAVVTKNAIRNADTDVSDDGAIYFGDLGPNTISNAAQATYNAIYGNGIAANSTKCIYLDGGVSNIAVTGNICAPASGAAEASGTAVAGEDVLFVHGGQNNVFTYNVIVGGATSANFTDVWGDTTNILAAVGYQTNPANGYGIVTSMGSNVFEHNIFYSFGAWPQSLWFISGTVGTPTVSTNDYFSAAGSSMSRTTAFRTAVQPRSTRSSWTLRTATIGLARGLRCFRTSVGKSSQPIRAATLFAVAGDESFCVEQEVIDPKLQGRQVRRLAVHAGAHLGRSRSRADRVERLPVDDDGVVNGQREDARFVIGIEHDVRPCVDRDGSGNIVVNTLERSAVGRNELLEDVNAGRPGGEQQLAGAGAHGLLQCKHHAVPWIATVRVRDETQLELGVRLGHRHPGEVPDEAYVGAIRSIGDHPENGGVGRRDGCRVVQAGVTARSHAYVGPLGTERAPIEVVAEKGGSR